MSRTFFSSGSTFPGRRSGDQIDVEGQFNNSDALRDLRRRTNANLDPTPSDDNDDDYSTDDDYTEEESHTDNPELLCNCCLQMMLLPTTLPCGHSFCRLCLANWYAASQKKSCPIDNKTWTSLPKVSVTLRNLEETLFPEALKRREAELDLTTSLERLVEFERQVATRPGLMRQASVNLQENIVNPRNILSIGGVIVALIIAWRWSSYSGQHLVHKEVLKWNTEDVETWMKEHGPWTKPNLVSVFKNRIDGYAILSDEKEILTGKFGMNDTVTENTIWREILLMRRDGYKPIKDVWEYKARWPDKLIRYSCLIGCSPRLTLLIIYLLDYDNGFMPMYNTLFHTENNSTDFSGELQDPTSGELWWMFIVGLIFPYYMYSCCAYAWCSAYIFIYALVICFESTTGDAMFVWDALERKTRYLERLLGIFIKSAVFICIPWTWVPTIVIEAAVAWCFFPAPAIVLVIGYCTIIHRFATERNAMDVIQWLRTL